jgi:hypothetical protein
MSDIEYQLRHVLRRKEPSEGFADRVMARIPSSAGQRKPSLWWRWVAAAAACLLLAAGAGRYEQHRRGLQARDQLLFAIEITEKKLAVVQSKVDELNRRSVPE